MNGEYEPCLQYAVALCSKVGCIQEDIFWITAQLIQESLVRAGGSLLEPAKQQQKIALGGGVLNRETKFMHSRNNPEIMPFELLPISLAWLNSTCIGASAW